MADRSGACRRSFTILGVVVLAANLSLGAASVSAAPAQDKATPQVIPIHFVSRIADIGDEDLATEALATLNDPRGWSQAGFSYTSDPGSDYQVILAEPAAVDALCAPLVTGGRVSCQNSNVVALNADRWRSATGDWDRGLDEYRHYLYNHEVGHLSGQFHPANRCPVAGEPEAVMAQQTKGLEGCTGNAWPLDWEIDQAMERPLKLAPAPDVQPTERAVNPGGGVPATMEALEQLATPTTERAVAPPPTSAAPEAPASTDAEVETPSIATPEAPKPDDEQGAPLPQDTLTVPQVSGGSAGLVIIAALIGALCLGAVLFTLISRSRRGRGGLEDADGSSGPAAGPGGTLLTDEAGASSRRAVTPRDLWRLQVAEGARKRANLAWHVPNRWPDQDAEALGDAVDLLGTSPTPECLVEVVSAFLKARTHLVPRRGESIALALLEEQSILGVVLGEASLVERRSGGARTARQRGVVRLRSDAADPLQVDFVIAEGDRRRSMIRASESWSAPARPADLAASN